MLDLYTWTTPNGRKASIMLEELGLPYEAHGIDLGKGQQHTPEFLAVSPSGKIPAIRERETGFTLMESGAIMLWLAERHGRFLPSGVERWRTIEWLMWQMGGVGPIFGQVHHFLKHNRGAAPYAEERFSKEAHRLYRVLDTQLAGRDFVTGEAKGEYTIADMAIWPWVSRFEWQEVDLGDYPSVKDWYLRIAERPAVQRGYHAPKRVNDIPIP